MNSELGSEFGTVNNWRIQEPVFQQTRDPHHRNFNGMDYTSHTGNHNDRSSMNHSQHSQSHRPSLRDPYQRGSDMG